MTDPRARAPGQVAGGVLDADLGRLTMAERVARGKAARAAAPRESHGVFGPPANRPDPVALLEQQAESRVPELVPIRYGRMRSRDRTRHRPERPVIAGCLELGQGGQASR